LIEHAQPARARDEVHPVAADLGMWPPGAVVERERRRRLPQCLLDDLGREQHALAARVEAQPLVEQPLAQRPLPPERSSPHRKSRRPRG
jgi:hypothetical protein